MCICLGMMGIYANLDVFYVIPFLTIEVYLALYVVSIGPISWIYCGEILSSRGMSIATGANWFSAFLTVLFFPFVVDGIGLSYTFWIFASVNISGAIYFALDMVETKGLTKDQIKNMMALRR